MTLDYTKLLRKLTPETQVGGDPGLQLRTGTVTALAADGTATVTLNGGSVPNVPVLGNVSLVVGAVVQMLSQRGSLLILGVTINTKRFCIKASDQNSPTNSTTPVDATDLSFVGAPNAVYLVDAYLSYGGSTSDAKFLWTGPSGFNMARYLIAPGQSNTNSQDTLMASLRRSPGTGQVAGSSGGGASEFTDYQEKSLVRIGATGGTVQLQFGQNGANATAITLHGDSFLIVERVG